jgi:hypothetical protein
LPQSFKFGTVKPEFKFTVSSGLFMLILHVYSEKRLSEQVETWRALRRIRGLFDVLDCRVQFEGDYDQAVLGAWGKEDLIVLEQDIVPSAEMFAELAACKEPWCCFKYQIRYLPGQDPAYWVTHGLGLTKFSVEAQKTARSDLWFHAGDWKWNNLDCRITGLLVKAGLAPHVHGVVRHNRVVDFYESAVS